MFQSTNTLVMGRSYTAFAKQEYVLIAVFLVLANILQVPVFSVDDSDLWHVLSSGYRPT